MASLKEMSAAERRAWYRRIGRKGGQARARMADFPAHQRRAGKRSAEVNDMAALGHRGAMATIRKHGYPYLYRLARGWRLANPSSHERAVMAILDELGVSYEREAEPLGDAAYVCVDFYLPVSGQVVEVNGKIHYDPLFDHPRYPAGRRQRDRDKVRRLEQAGLAVLVIDYHDLADQDEVRRRVRRFVWDGRSGCQEDERC